eukprot:gene36868-biopygen31972
MITATCSNTGPWPVTYSDFTTLLAVSYDLSTCLYLPGYSSCPKSSCGSILQGSATYSSDPEGDAGTCYYGGGYGTCDALPDGDYRRFCPCLQSSIGTTTLPPSPRPTVLPTRLPTPSPSMATIYTFYYTGSYQTFYVPAGVYSITVTVYGAQGASTAYSSGGYGGYILTTVSVTPNTYLYIYVGGAGSVSSGGYNGGGNGGNIYAGGGGGATDIRTGYANLYSRIVVAGGGGGAGRDGGVNYINGGGGGGLTGSSGSYDSNGGVSTYGGYGGSQYSGGSGGYFPSYTYGGSGIYGSGGAGASGTGGG